MPKGTPTPTPGELEILKVLWDRGPSSVRDVYRIMLKEREQKGEDLAYNTVQTLLRIMEKKQLVGHHVEGRAFIYSPLYSREESVRGYIDRVFDGAAEQLMMTLLKIENLSADEIKRLQEMIDEARNQQDKS